ncbi:MAG: PilN domain-containing protein [Rhodoferax sp.]|nr:PilN domain-containing protein [Rhodoferax sp.]
MILINLLPHREAARKRRRDVFHGSLVVSVFIGGLLAGAVYLWFESEISARQNANQMIKAETTKLEEQIKEIAQLEEEIAALKARQQAVEDLQSDRNLPVHLLSELVNELPDGSFISKMTQTDQLITLSGTAQSNERVSELLRNLGNKTPWFAKPELVEIVSGNLIMPNKEQKRVSNFVIRVRLVRSSEAAKAALAAASASASGAASIAVKQSGLP